MLDVSELEDFQVLKDLKDLKDPLDLPEFKELKDPQDSEELKEILDQLDLPEKHTHVLKLTQLIAVLHLHLEVPSLHLLLGQFLLENWLL